MPGPTVFQQLELISKDDKNKPIGAKRGINKSMRTTNREINKIKRTFLTHKKVF